nr:MAG TPA: hypothetical protein [Caudoviricetes sp.]
MRNTCRNWYSRLLRIRVLPFIYLNVGKVIMSTVLYQHHLSCP